MRYLLALVLMVPAFAQQPDQPSKADDKTAQAPAKTDSQAAQEPAKTEDKAASAAPSPAPSGEEWFTGSVDFGYRWLTGVNGSFPEYRSVVNLGQGLKLNGLDFTITDPKKRLFDRLDASAYGWGGDPYNTARLNAHKQGVYDFTFDYRNMAYFDAVPSYANPLAPARLQRAIVRYPPADHDRRARPAAREAHHSLSGIRPEFGIRKRHRRLGPGQQR